MIEKKHNLQPPGSGLPRLERLFIKYILVPFAKYGLGWKSSQIWLDYEIGRIETSIQNLNETALDQRVLIDHILGIEDDTRDWSISLVIEHLCIVTEGIIEVIKTLGEEKTVEMQIRIEDVKPQEGAVDFTKLKAIVTTYKAYTPPKRNSHMTKAHPWFIEFNDQEWHTFLAIHTWVHRRQIEAIVKKLS